MESMKIAQWIKRIRKKNRAFEGGDWGIRKNGDRNAGSLVHFELFS